MIRYFTRHPTGANLLMLLFVAMGLFSVRSLRRETLPDFTPAEVEIRVPYPGATAEEVEEVVCQRVEDALDGIKFLKELRTEAREGRGIITAEMEEDGNFQTFKDEIDTEVAAIDDFPSDVEDPIIKQLGTTELVLALLVAGPMPAPDLKAYSEDLKDRLRQHPEISLVTIRGFSKHQFRIELSAEALMSYGISVADVGDIIARQSLNLPAGALETRERDIMLRFVEERRSPEELEDVIIVAGEGGAEIRLGDLGNVVDLFEFDEVKVDLFEVRQDRAIARSGRAALLYIEKTKNQDTIRVANTVKEFLEEERQRQPQVRFIVTQDSSTLVRGRLQLLLQNGWQGLLLVFFTLWLFFSLRLSFWVTMGLPVSFLGAFFFLPLLGLTINMLTMVGLLLALGLLMDDAIVIAENIATHLRRGRSALQAAVDGVNEVKVGVFSSFVTTACVLGPLVAIEGDIGKVLKVVPMILILVMSVSLIEAFLILPAHLAHSLRGFDPENVGWFRRRCERLVEWLRESVLGRLVDFLVHWRYVFIGFMVCTFLATLGLVAGGIVKFRAFPELDGDVIVARLLLPQGTPLRRTEEAVEQIIGSLERTNRKFAPLQPNGSDLVRNVYVEYNENTDAFENGAHVATVSVDLLSAEIREARIDEVVRTWIEETGQLADVLSLVFAEPSFGPAGRPIEIRLTGRNLEELKEAVGEMERWLAPFVGVYNLAVDLRKGKEELRLRLREGAVGLGLDAQSIARQLRAAYYGVTSDEIQVEQESYEIDVRLRRDDQDSLEDLEYFHVTLPDGKQVPLHAVARAETGRGWARIARVDGLRTVTLRGDIDSEFANTTSLIQEVKEKFLPDLEAKYQGIRVSFEGEVKQGTTTQQSMMRAMLFGLVGVFILLSFQFRSYIEPLVVMLAIPFSLIGVIWGHLLMGLDLSLPSMLGFISLAGVVVNDSILLVVFLKNRQREGAEIHASATQASRERFRAVILTSLTTIAGLLPLLAERSLQAQILIPLAVSIVFGLLASTVLVLLVVPSLYTILGDFGLVANLEKEEGDDEVTRRR